MRRFTAIAASAMLAVGAAACGGDDGGGDDQEAAADLFLEQAEQAGIDGDDDCVREKADKLSDADAKAIVDAGSDGSPELSPEGEALSLELAGCVSTEDLMDQVLSSLPEGVDEDCVRDALEDVDLSAIAGGDTPPEFATAIAECVTGG